MKRAIINAVCYFAVIFSFASAVTFIRKEEYIFVEILVTALVAALGYFAGYRNGTDDAKKKPKNDE